MHVTRQKCEDYASGLGLKGHAMSGRVCRMSRFIIRSREAGCLTRRRARPPMRACGCDHAAPPSAGWDESGSPEGAMTCLNGGPPLTVSGEDQPAAAEHLQQAPFMPAAPAGHTVVGRKPC